jgi:hypothetical protein
VSREDKGRRELLGLLITLAGLSIGIIGAALTWAVDRSGALPAFGSALYVSPNAGKLNGFQIKVGFLSMGWLLILVCGLCGLLLLANPTAEEKPPYLRLQATLGAFILFLGVLYIRPYLGPAMAAISGTLLVSGAFLRYR